MIFSSPKLNFELHVHRNPNVSPVPSVPKCLCACCPLCLLTQTSVGMEKRLSPSQIASTRFRANSELLEPILFDVRAHSSSTWRAMRGVAGRAIRSAQHLLFTVSSSGPVTHPYLARAHSTRHPKGEQFRIVKVTLTRHTEKHASEHQGESTWKVPNTTKNENAQGR